jgi:hypothetical protein
MIEEVDTKIIIEENKNNFESFVKNSQFQLAEIKYPTFDNALIDDELKTDITYEILINDFKAIFDLLEHYRNIFTDVLITNPGNLIASFKIYNLNFLIFHINGYLIKRQVELISYLIKIKFEHNDEEKMKESSLYELIKSEFENKTVDDLLLTWSSNETFRKHFFDNVENILEIREVFARELEQEKFLIEIALNSEETPSICGIGVFLKYLKLILLTAIGNVNNLDGSASEEGMLDFFQDVLFYILYISAANYKLFQISLRIHLKLTKMIFST